METVKSIYFQLDDKKPATIKALALFSFAAIILIWAIQPVTVTIPLGNQHTDWLFVDGVRYFAYDYDHTQNPPIRYHDVQVLNPGILIDDFHVHYEYETVKKTDINGNVSVNLTFYNASAVGEFTVRRYIIWIHETPGELKDYLGVSVPRYDDPGNYTLNNSKMNL